MADDEVDEDVSGEVAHVQQEGVVAENAADPAEAEREGAPGERAAQQIADPQVVLMLQEPGVEQGGGKRTLVVASSTNYTNKS